MCTALHPLSDSSSGFTGPVPFRFLCSPSLLPWGGVGAGSRAAHYSLSSSLFPDLLSTSFPLLFPSFILFPFPFSIPFPLPFPHFLSLCCSLSSSSFPFPFSSLIFFPFAMSRHSSSFPFPFIFLLPFPLLLASGFPFSSCLGEGLVGLPGFALFPCPFP